MLTRTDNICDIRLVFGPRHRKATRTVTSNGELRAYCICELTINIVCAYVVLYCMLYCIACCIVLYIEYAHPKNALRCGYSALCWGYFTSGFGQ